MDDKVLKLIDRAINEGLSYGEVESIMAFNGYDQVAIDQALSEIKKKRPEFVSDVQFPSEQTDSTAFNVPSDTVTTAGQSPLVSSEEVSDDPLAKFKADYYADRGGLNAYADKQIQTAQDLNKSFREADPDPMNFFEKSYQRLKGIATAPNIAIGLEYGNMYESLERSQQQEAFDQDTEAQKELRDQRILANAAINDHFGFDFNLYEEDENGVLVANKEKRDKFQEYLEGLNLEGEYIRNQIAIEDAINKEQALNQLGPYQKWMLEAASGKGVDVTGLASGFATATMDAMFPGLGSKVDALEESASLFGDNLVNNLIGMGADLIGADEATAGRIKQQEMEKRAAIKLQAGIDPRDERTFTDYFAEGEVGLGSLSLGLTLAEQVPQIAVTIVAPEIGLAAGAVSAGGSTYMDQRNRLDMSASDKFFSTVVSAGAEYLFEKIAFGDIQAARRSLGIDDGVVAATKAEKEAIRKNVTNELRKKTKWELPKSIGRQAVEEGGEEIAVELTNSALAYLISGEIPEPKEFVESFIVGAIMGGGTTAGPAILAKGMNSMATYAQMKEFKAVTDEINSLRNQLKENMSPYDRQVITERLKELGIRQAEITAVSMDLYSAMPQEAQAALFGIQKDFAAAYKAYNETTSEDAKKSHMDTMKRLLKDKALIEQEYGGEARLALLSDPKKAGIKEEYNESFEDSTEFEGKIEAGNGISTQSARALNNIFGAIRGKKKVRVHNNVRSLLNANKDARALAMQGGSSPGYYDRSTNTIHVLSPEAFRAYNQHRENLGRPTQDIAKVYQHEVIHPIIQEMMDSDPETQARLYNEIEALRGKDSIADEAFAFGEKYASRGADTQQNEVVTEFLALMSRKINIDRMSRENPGLLQRIKDMFNDMLLRAGVSVKVNSNDELMTIAENLANAMRMGSAVVVDAQKQTKTKKRKSKAPATAPVQGEVAPAMAAEPDIELSIDDVMFTLFNDSYEDTERIAKLNRLVEEVQGGDQLIEGIVRKTVNQDDVLGVLQFDDLPFIPVDELEEMRIKISDAAQQVRADFISYRTLIEAAESIDQSSADYVTKMDDAQDALSEFIDSLSSFYRMIETDFVADDRFTSSLFNGDIEVSRIAPLVRDFYAESESAFGIDFSFADDVDYRPPSDLKGYLSMLPEMLAVYGSVIDEVAFEDYDHHGFTPNEIETNLFGEYGPFRVMDKILDVFYQTIDTKKVQTESSTSAVKYDDLVFEMKQFVSEFVAQMTNYGFKSEWNSFDDTMDALMAFVQYGIKEDKNFLTKASERLLGTKYRYIYKRDAARGTLFDQPRGIQFIYSGGAGVSRDFDLLEMAKSYPNIQKVMDAIGDDILTTSTPRSINDSDVIQKALFSAIVDLKTEGELNKLVGPSSPLGSVASKVFQLDAFKVEFPKKVSLLPPTHDMFDEEFNLNSGLAESLNPDNVKMQKATPDQWMAHFAKNKSAAQEAEFINIRAWLEETYQVTGKTIPLAEVQQYVKNTIITPKVFTPAGHYMWSKAKYNKETGEVVVPVKSYLDDVLVPGDDISLERAEENLQNFLENYLLEDDLGKIVLAEKYDLPYSEDSGYDLSSVDDVESVQVFMQQDPDGNRYIYAEVEGYVDVNGRYNLQSVGSKYSLEGFADTLEASLEISNTGVSAKYDESTGRLSFRTDETGYAESEPITTPQPGAISLGEANTRFGSFMSEITTTINQDIAFILLEEQGYDRDSVDLDSLEIRYEVLYNEELEDYEIKSFVKADIMSEDLRDFNTIEIQPGSDFARFADTIGMALRDSVSPRATASYDAATGIFSYAAGGLSDQSEPIIPSQTVQSTEGSYRTEVEKNYAYKTMRMNPGLSEKEAISKAMVSFGTRGNKVLGKFGGYSLATKGKDSEPTIINYTEVLVTVPRTLTDKQNRKPFVVASHFDVENVVVHLRVGEGQTVDGKRILFIDEIQSDWGQGARKRGQGENPFGGNKTDIEAAKNAIQAVFDLSSHYSFGLSGMSNQIAKTLNDAASINARLDGDLWIKKFVDDATNHSPSRFDLYSLGFGGMNLPWEFKIEVVNEINPSWKESAEGQKILEENKKALDRIKDLLYPLKRVSNRELLHTSDPLINSDPKYWGATGLEARINEVKSLIEERLLASQESLSAFIKQGTTQTIVNESTKAEVDKMYKAIAKEYDKVRGNAIKQIKGEIDSLLLKPIKEAMEKSGDSIIKAEAKAVDVLTRGGLQTLSDGMNALNAVRATQGMGSAVPYSPWNQNNRWVNMGMRVATKMAVDGGFDYVAWTPGDIQSKRYGGQSGLEAFYNNALPSITKNEIKRFDKKSKPGVLKMRNRINDTTSGSFDILGYPITDKIKDQFSEGTSSFTLDEDYGAGIPSEVKSNPVTILNALEFADQSEIATNLEFKENLTKMLHEDPNRDAIISKYGLVLQKGPDGLMHYKMNQGLMNYLIDSFELETLIAIKAYPDAIGWYDETVTKAMTVVELMYPEIKNDPDKAAIMKMSIAITSNGLKVKQNFALAVKQYEYFRKNGKFNPELVEGTQGGAMTTSFTFINKVLDVMSVENFVNFLTTPVRNGEMFYYKVGKDGKKSKQNLTGNYPADYELFGASVFGPKIGNGFFMNLMGEFQTLTIDRWLTRQFGRLRGDLLIGRNLENTKKADKRFKKAVKALGKRDRKKLTFLTNELSNLDAKMTGRDGEIQWNEIASDISSSATNSDNLAILQSNPKLQELRKAANGLTKYLAGEKEAPATGRERVFMEDVFRGVQKNLMTKYGISITIADLQAVNWYPEKALYQTFQANSSISSAKDFTSEEEKPDYFSGASEVARSKGITQKQIDNAIEQLDFRHESIRKAVGQRDGQLGTADKEADLEGIRKAINQVRANEEVTKTFFHLDDEFTGFTQGSRLGDVKYSSVQPHVKQAKTYLERKMNVQPYMELEGPDVVKSPADIAFLLRHMESDSSESTFLVVRDINNPENYDVTYMTTGTVNSALVDNIKIRQIVTNFQEAYGLDTEIEVTLVHNHPSGNLMSSPADQNMHRGLLELFEKEDKVQIGDSVIINLDSGKYTTFTSSASFGSKEVPYGEFEGPGRRETKKVKVQNFNRQELFRPRTADKLQIKGPTSIPLFLSHFKVSPTTKLGYVIMNQQNVITRIAVLDSASSPRAIGLMMERTTGKYGNSVIFFGNDKDALKVASQFSKEGLDRQNIKILDVIYIESDPAHRHGFWIGSASDRGMTPGGRMTNFTLEEVSEAAPEGAMSIEESLQVTEMQAEQSPLYRERDLDLPNFEEIQSVIKGHKAGKKILDENAPLQDGDLVGGRLNLNLVEAGQNKYGYRMSILSVHKAKSQDSKKYQEHNGVSTFAREKVVRNFDVMTIRNAYFNVNVKGSSEVGAMLFNKFVKKMNPAEIKEKYPTAKNKFPLASVDGEFVDIPRENSNFDGVMIKYNPMTSHMFMDVTGRPIKFAEEVTLMGDRAYARGKIIYADTAWDLHSVPGMGVEDFIVPTKVTTNPDKITATHNMMMESGIQFTIDDSGHESHNIIDEGVVNMRRTASRFAASLGDKDADIRKKIYDNPKNYINPQKLGDIKDRLEDMSDADLIEAMSDNALVNLSLNPENGNDNIYVLAAIERINRMQANGEDTADAIEALAKVGTTVGRMLRHFAELKTSSPIGIVQMIESAMGKAGRRMTDAQRQNLMVIAQKFIEAQRALIDHHDNLGQMDSAEFTKEFTRLSKELDAITRTLNKVSAVLIPKTYGNLLGTFIKGNLMTPVSLVTNVVANIFEQGRFAIQRPIESAVHFASFRASKLISKFLGKDVGVKEYYGREMGVTLLALPFALKRGALGFAQSMKGMLVKSGETDKIVHTGINPMFALYAMVSDTALGNYLQKKFGMSLLTTDFLPRTKEGKIKPGDRIKLMVEGIFGIAPDIVFRALSVGDLPFSQFSGSFVVYNEAVKKFGLSNRNTEEFKNFLRYPPQDVLMKMTREGQRATFQEKNKAADALLQFRKIVEGKGTIPGRMMGFLFDSFMPYIKTPANIFVSTMKIAMPGLGAMSAMYNYSQGNHKKANEDLSMAVVGAMIIKAADMLIAAGAIIGAFTDEDKEEKALQYAYTGGPMRVNKTAIGRFLTSFNDEDLQYQEGDVWVKIDKAGIVGVVMGARATATKGLKHDKASKNNTYYFPGEDPLFDVQFINKYLNPQMVGGTFKFINSMSFLQGANSLLSLIAGDAEGYDMQRNIDNWFRSVTSTVLPNTISALNRAGREFMPIFRNKDAARRMKYILLDKTFNVDGYPARVDMVGRDILQTPPGKNPYYYHLFSVLKGQEIDPHPVIQEYYRLAVATGDGSWLPSAPGKITEYFYSPSKTDLGPTLHKQIMGLIGPGEKAKIRFNEEELVKIQKQFFQDLTTNVEAMMATDLYQNAEDDVKVELLQGVIDDTKKMKVTVARDRKFGTVKLKNTWYEMFTDIAYQGAERLHEQLKEEE